ncbi:MAG: hypothetical protein KKG50_05630 [Candidatus Omnitrophica bacterium]|nr:hypothetical protein [Candidatus Omnitrophota bacterium]
MKIKTHKVLLLFTFFLFLSFSSYSAPCYGTKMPKEKEFFAGVGSYTIFKRDLEDGYGSLRSLQNFLLLSYGIFDWLSLDLKVGAGYIKQHPFGSDEIDYPTAFSGGYGLRLKVYNKKKVQAVFGFQHISVHPRKARLQEENKAILDDWQVSFLASYEFPLITPYAGVEWSRVDYIHWQGDRRKRRMSDLTKSIGLVVGFDFPLKEKFWLNLEGQFFDAKALSFSVNFSF